MLNRLLFLFTVGLSLALMVLVLLAPQIVQEQPQSQPHLLLLFAFDATVRRAAILCALGLLVTAVVFFRAASKKDDASGKRKRSPTSRSIGA